MSCSAPGWPQCVNDVPTFWPFLGRQPHQPGIPGCSEKEGLLIAAMYLFVLGETWLYIRWACVSVCVCVCVRACVRA